MSRIVFAAAMIASSLRVRAPRARVSSGPASLGSCTSLTAPAPEGGQWL